LGRHRSVNACEMPGPVADVAAVPEATGEAFQGGGS
jgi:hypothetical protein